MTRLSDDGTSTTRDNTPVIQIKTVMSWNMSNHIPIIITLNLRTDLTRLVNNTNTIPKLYNNKNITERFHDIQFHQEWNILLEHLQESPSQSHKNHHHHHHYYN